MKKYSDCMDEITADEIYKGLLGYGLFNDKLPPLFQSASFYKYCIHKNYNFKDTFYDYINYDSVRNINTNRRYSIPNPMAYERLCNIIRNNWEQIKAHFHKYTDNLDYKISRIHIRKIAGEAKLMQSINYGENAQYDMQKEITNEKLFRMSKQKLWKYDGSPEDEFIVECKFIVHADISKFFPSIYTHSIPWALVGKEEAKQKQRDKNEWYNKFDKICYSLRNGETHGLMIGPHASNLISEIILIVVDKMLYDDKWKFVRNIDDYTCFVRNETEAQLFINDLNRHLKCFDLLLNDKKTEIKSAPYFVDDNWTFIMRHELNKYTMVDYLDVKYLFYLASKLMGQSENNASIVNYLIKGIGKKEFTDNAIKIYVRQCMHFGILYPYLLSLMDEYVFIKFNVLKEDIEKFAVAVYDNSKRICNYEGMMYALFWAIKYEILLYNVNLEDILLSDNCLLKLIGYIYAKNNILYNEIIIKQYKSDALRLLGEIDANWIYVYEVLSTDELPEEWKNIKKSKVSFIKNEYFR